MCQQRENVVYLEDPVIKALAISFQIFDVHIPLAVSTIERSKKNRSHISTESIFIIYIYKLHVYTKIGRNED
jgi:hypothetical protein